MDKENQTQKGSLFYDQDSNPISSEKTVCVPITTHARAQKITNKEVCVFVCAYVLYICIHMSV